MSSHMTPLSYVVLNLIGRDGAGPHDLVQMARRGQRLYWAGAESKIYAEPKRLAKLGYDGELVDALNKWAGNANLEERVDGVAEIDPIVLEELRELS